MRRVTDAAVHAPPLKLRDRAYESFRQHLLALDIRPGQFISQRELVVLTGLSLAAIRETIPRLEADGLIATVPKRGLRIAALDLKLVRNAFELRRILECEAVAVFTRHASDAEIAKLVAAHQAVLARAEASDRSKQLLDQAQTTDWAMHDALIEGLGNELVRNIYRVNSIKVRLARLEQSLLSEAVLMSALQEHSRVLAAIAARDVAGAQAALRAHIESAHLRALGISPGAGRAEPHASPIDPAARSNSNP
jgi:DNA-binding GntR family transcriptional regulator